jgi:hypothetical protein
MPEKAENLESLTNPEISQRLAKIAKRVPQTFGVLVVMSLVMTFAGFWLNNNGYPIAGGIVSILGALFVIAGALYMRKMRIENDELLEVSIKRHVDNLK